MARPSKYETHVAPRLIEVEDWVRNGATDKEVAQRLGISVDTMCVYKKEFSEFSEVLKKGREFTDAEVENALLRRALGYSFTERTRELMDGILVETKVVTKHIPPDVTAQIFWLKNRRADAWKERSHIDANVTNDNKELMRDYLDSIKQGK